MGKRNKKKRRNRSFKRTIRTLKKNRSKTKRTPKTLKKDFKHLSKKRKRKKTKKYNRKRIYGGTSPSPHPSEVALAEPEPGKITSIYYLCGSRWPWRTHCGIGLVVDYKMFHIYDLSIRVQRPPLIDMGSWHNKIRVTSLRAESLRWALEDGVFTTGDAITNEIVRSVLPIMIEEPQRILHYDQITSDITLQDINRFNEMWIDNFPKYNKSAVMRCSMIPFCPDLAGRLKEATELKQSGTPMSACCWNYSDDLYEFVTRYNDFTETSL